MIMMGREWTMIEDIDPGKPEKNGSTVLTFHPQGNEVGRKLEKITLSFL